MNNEKLNEMADLYVESLDPEIVKDMPFTSVKEAFKAALSLPEVKECFRLVKKFVSEGDDTYCTCGAETGSEESWKDPECLYHESIKALADMGEVMGEN